MTQNEETKSVQMPMTNSGNQRVQDWHNKAWVKTGVLETAWFFAIWNDFIFGSKTWNVTYILFSDKVHSPGKIQEGWINLCITVNIFLFSCNVPQAAEKIWLKNDEMHISTNMPELNWRWYKFSINAESCSLWSRSTIRNKMIEETYMRWSLITQVPVQVPGDKTRKKSIFSNRIWKKWAWLPSLPIMKW